MIFGTQRLLAAMAEHKAEMSQLLVQAAAIQGENRRLELENQRLVGQVGWFAHRLNQIERERGQLIQAAIGVKVSVPEFVVVDPDQGQKDALTELPDLGTVGEDAREEDPELQGRPTFMPTGSDNPDFSLMPGYDRQR
jgi:hypothetical protein